jgi:ELWxxDGT repeat protein
MRRSTPCPSLLVLSVLVFAAPVAAQPAHRVKDINPGGNTTWPYDLTASGGRLFFVADDGPHGPELWTSDGTGAGTVRVPGTSGIGRVFTGSSGVYFTRDAAALDDLWRSDGTPGGTALVTSGLDYVHESATVGALTYFATGNSTPAVLWRTDGTAAGTFQVFGDDGQEPRYVRQLVGSDGLLYFFAAGSSPVMTLWRSDGTAAGTWPLVGATASTSEERTLAPFGDHVIFAANDGVHGTELWTSDGTPQGTTLLADLVPGSEGSGPADMTVAGGRLYFWAGQSATGVELWATDGTTAGTGLVADVMPGPVSTHNGEAASVGGRLFFANGDDGGLWTSDGTGAGTVVLRTGLEPAGLTALGSRLLFFAGGFYADLWTSDGTVAGTSRVRWICPEGGCTEPRSLTRFGGLLYFLADDGVYGPQLWRSDGTADGTVRVAVVRPGETSSSPRDFQEIKGTAYFLTSTSYAPGETTLWASDGSGTGTVPVVTGLSRSSELTATSNRLFWVDDGHLYPPFVLMMSDGTAAGTGPVPFPPELTNVEQPVCTDEKAFFFERTGQGLWVADGTPAGTQWLEEFSAASGTGDLRELVPLAGNVVFRVQPVGGGAEIWRTDGTAAGTARVKALSTRPYPECGGARRLRRSVLFLADDGSTGCNVWRSDGTPDGTVPLGIVGAGSSAQMSVIGSARGFLVFTDYTELWRSDGTAAGTFLLRSFPTQALAMAPGAGTHEGVYFAVQSNGQPDTTQQLWITDGTVAGTVLLHDFKAGSENSRIASVTTANGRLLASIGDATVYRPSLWTSDGTPAGTVMVQDQAGASPGGLPFRGVTLFPGTDKWAGTELWAMDGHAFTASVRPTSLYVVTPCRVVDTRNANGFLGGPTLEARVPRVFPVGGTCGIPATARSIAANVTVTGATSDGLLRIHASDIGAPDATVVNFLAGRTRANNATIGLGSDAEFTIRFEAPYGEAHVIVDVVGWYE